LMRFLRRERVVSEKRTRKVSRNIIQAVRILAGVSFLFILILLLSIFTYVLFMPAPPVPCSGDMPQDAGAPPVVGVLVLMLVIIVLMLSLRRWTK